MIQLSNTNLNLATPAGHQLVPLQGVVQKQPTIEQNGGASDLLLESLNPRGCAERTSELRL